MSPITALVEIKRSPQDVFLYVADPTQRPNWQDALEHIEVVRTTPEGVGTRVRETRRIQGSSRTFTWEVTEYDPGRRYALRGIDGPVRARVLMNLTPVDQGAKTRVAIEIAFDGVGIGKMLAPPARRGASKEVNSDGQHLKDQLEGGLT
jgi:uncharacterized protein YndB with AHSA1/START domain